MSEYSRALAWGTGHGIAEQPVLAPDDKRTQGVFDGIGINTVAPVVAEAYQCVPLVC